MAKEKLTRSKLRRIIREEKQKLDEAGNRTPSSFATMIGSARDILGAEATGNGVAIRLVGPTGSEITARIEGGDFYIE